MDRIKKILRWLVPLLLGVLLFWLVYRKMDLASMREIFALGLRWEWVAVYFLLFLLPMIIRGIRWHQLLEPVCPGGRVKTAILAVFVAYGANLLFPRIGEVARCGLLKKHDGLSFSRSLGTVVTERVFDIICLVLMALAAILSQMDVFREFLRENPVTPDKFTSLLTSWKLWAVLLLLAALVLVARRALKGSRIYQKVRDTLRQMWQGMISVKTLRHPWLFIFWTVCIWTFYFLSFYVGQYFFHLPFALSVMAMFTAHIMGSFGIVAPVQGGIGAWHFMVIYTLVFYGIPEAQAGSFALVVHGLNLIMTAVCGLLAWLWLSLADRRRA